MANQFKNLNDILQKLLRDLDIEHKVNQSKAIVVWPKIVGKRIAEVSNPERIANGILYVRVSSPVWRSELVFMKYKIPWSVIYSLIYDFFEKFLFHKTCFFGAFFAGTKRTF